MSRAEVSSTQREVLQGERDGLDIVASVPAASRDVLQGDRVGMDVVTSVPWSIRETLISEPPYRFTHNSREVLVSLPDDPVSVSHLARQLTYRAVQGKAVTQADAMWSWTQVAQVSQLSVAGRPLSIPISQAILGQVGLLAGLQRTTRPAGEVISPLDVQQAAMLVTRSRDKAHEPVSAAFTRQLTQLAATQRDTVPAGSVIGALRTLMVASITVQRADRPMPLTGTWTYQAAQLVTGRRAMPVTYSGVRASKLLTLVTRQRQLAPPFTWAFVRQSFLQAVQFRPMGNPRSPVRTGKAITQVTQARETEIHRSSMILSAQVLQVLQARMTPPPDAMVGLMAGNTGVQVAQGRGTQPAGAVRSPITTHSAHISFTMWRETPHPDDVIDPSVGRHVGQLAVLTAQHRVTEPPTDTGGPVIRMQSLALASVLRDTDFPEPPTEPTDLAIARLTLLAQVAVLPDREFPPQSRVYVPTLAQSVLLADPEGWIDPTVPVSDAALHGQAQFVALGDTSLPPADEVLSDAQLHQVARAVAMEDSAGWMDPTVPNSDARVRQVAELPVLGDTTLPPGDWPLSVAHVTQVASSAAVKDPSISGRLQGSDAGVYVLAEQVVMRDTTMLRLPPRPAAARPVISISIT